MKIFMLAATILLTAGAANAATFFKGSLSGSQETVPNASTATGNGTIELSDDMNSIKVNLSWNNLTAPAAAGHIHCCAFLGAIGPVAIDLAPSNVITGSASGTFDLTLAGTYGGVFLNANGNNAVSARAAFLAGLTGGKAYFNVHNQNFPAGEIRGQIAAVPEPATWAMLIAGFGMVGASLRRRTAITA